MTPLMILKSQEMPFSSNLSLYFGLLSSRKTVSDSIAEFLCENRNFILSSDNLQVENPFPVIEISFYSFNNTNSHIITK